MEGWKNLNWIDWRSWAKSNGSITKNNLKIKWND